MKGLVLYLSPLKSILISACRNGQLILIIQILLHVLFEIWLFCLRIGCCDDAISPGRDCHVIIIQRLSTLPCFLWYIRAVIWEKGIIFVGNGCNVIGVIILLEVLVVIRWLVIGFEAGIFFGDRAHTVL